MIDKFFTGVEYIAKHDKVRYASVWFIATAIMTLCGVKFYQWQYWVIFILLIAFLLLMYVCGRVDEEKSNGDILEQLKPDIKEQIYNAVAESMLAKTGRIPKITVTEKEMN